ncbi:hypothetical protein M9458_018258, partial [Cirrhinus mrigala]
PGAAKWFRACGTANEGGSCYRASFLDSDELERTGIDLGTTGRLQLMARLAE